MKEEGNVSTQKLSKKASGLGSDLLGLRCTGGFWQSRSMRVVVGIGGSQRNVPGGLHFLLWRPVEEKLR